MNDPLITFGVVYVYFFCALCDSVEVFRAETQDGGDAKVEVSPRDIIFTQPAEPLEGEEPEILHQLDLRYGYDSTNMFCLIFPCKIRFR